MRQLQNNSIDLKNVWIFSLYGMVWYGMVWYGMVWYGMVWYGMVWYGMVWSFPDANSYANAIAKSPQSTPPLCRSTEGTSISRASKLIAKLDLLIYRIISTNKTQKLNLISVVSWGDSIR